MISLRDVVTGFGNRDPLAEVWWRNLRGGGSTEITGTLPLRYIGNGTPLTDYLISGNTVQNGTPTPEAPVDVVGCGERTANVMPAGEQKTIESNGIISSSDGKGKYTISGRATGSVSATFNLLSAFTTPISVLKGGKGTLSFFNTKSDNKVDFLFYNGETKVDNWHMFPIERVNTAYTSVGNKYIDIVGITVSSGTTVDMTITPEFTNNGVLPASFEPYGYKLPLTVNGVEYPIYLGQVPTTRRIKKLVLTGEENITSGHLDSNLFNVPVNDYLKASIIGSICTHYKAQQNVVGWDLVQNKKACFYIGSAVDFLKLYIRDSSYSTISDFKSYLAAQYAAGTPVTVWYVLAEPETGIVNEPLHKIGEYADTISFAQAGVTIPTVAGANTLTIDTTVKPSEVSITGNIKEVQGT